MMMQGIVLATLVFAAASVSALFAPTLSARLSERANSTISINPSKDTLHTVPRVSQLEARYLTNAKRLAAGLPLKPPVRRTATPTGNCSSQYREYRSDQDCRCCPPSSSPVWTAGISVRFAPNNLCAATKRPTSPTEKGDISKSPSPQKTMERSLVSLRIHSMYSGSIL